MTKQYERRIGTRTIYGTDWPVDLIVTKTPPRTGRRWELSERCNGICEHVNFFATKAEAIAEAEETLTLAEIAEKYKHNPGE